MRIFTYTTYLILVTAILSPAFAASAFDGLLQDCIGKQFDGADEVRRDSVLPIKKSCPELARAFRQARQLSDPRLVNITPTPGAKLTLAQLQDIRYSLHSFITDPERQYYALDRQLLDGIIKDTYVPFEDIPKELSLFERLNKWLTSLFDQDDPDEQSPTSNWFSALGIDKWNWGLIFQVIAVLFILFTLFIIFNELRTGSIGERLRRSGYRALRMLRKHEGSTSRSKFTWSELKAMTPRQRIVALLRYQLSMLVRRRQLVNERNKTNREIAEYLHSQNSAYADGFDELAPTADRALYGPHELSEDRSQRVETIVRKAERGGDEK